ncbi:glycosyltransferase family 2 protein [Leeuwenhoekiella polynyae]|uniref:Glycosyltransferase involved in cell wall biosynthesis n=1 Tax=Leeuwenhoekiella polynyae TaxID=1550906 RepID=A0A4Q0PEE1_9FLAO|nr:glycosyltransferase family 2 protein [Leeuwenhoekiella polynyae]RXG25183.1 glycosyltransferase involved in cell wall biosynthesis [Leeuwenhoekiella polynyae]
MKELISIIIPVYNRESYVIETLNSINKQTYTTWECILVDDGSTDQSIDLINKFIKDKPKYKLYRRPKSKIKGANSCRNFGFSKSSGSLVKFFDSDDLMTPDHLELCRNAIFAYEKDFVVSDSINFYNNEFRGKPYEFDRRSSQLNMINFAMYRVAWITDDLLLKRELAEKLRFKEGIEDNASEYHYNLKLLGLTLNGLLLPEVNTYRRIHDSNMINTTLKRNIDQILAENKFTALEYVEDLSTAELQRWFLSGYIQLSFKLTLSKKWPKYTWRSIPYLARYYSFFKAGVYPLALVTGYLFGKGYNVVKYIRS